MVLSKTFVFFLRQLVSPQDSVRGPYKCLDSIQNLCFFFQVIGFLVGLSTRTIQCPGSVQNFCFFLGSWFPHKLVSVDHTMPWFCQKPQFFLMWLVSPWAGDRGPYNTLVLSKTFSFFSQVVDFSIGLSPRTIQCLGSVENLCFFFLVIGFPTGLGPRTIQCLGSVQNLCLFSGSWFPHRLESEDHTIPWFRPKFLFFLRQQVSPLA